jgi:lipopolysaccharide export LptBFGC system permease protein LptF
MRFLVSLHWGLQAIGRSIAQLVLAVLALALVAAPLIGTIFATLFAASEVTALVDSG